MKAFVAGATGGTGRCIVAELVKRNIPVRALVRDLEAAKKILPAEVELVVGDVLQKETLVNAIADCTVLLSATGAKPSLDPFAPYMVDYEGTKNLVNAAKAKGIEQFVMVSSLCTSLVLHPLNLFWLVLFWKKQAEEFLQVSGLPYTIVRPGGLKYEDNDDVVIMKPADTLFEGSIPRPKVAKVCVDALFQATARNKIVEVIAKAGIAVPTTEQSTDIAELFANLA
ncbi:SDR family oxidoreductase [Tumidithrix elongata RA019]|uniref:SDR family oxidoreductase n=1 Tax=Tumidithrix elongata BACA0141 TaxID=2716417 RepID=A0AAW9Q1B3_9CYAN|nr:SDR family oxidoreductase [Tumidithrix elongata RA019]